MKKQIYITIGAIIVLILVLVWVYLLFFGTPKNANDIFSDLGIAGKEDTTVIIPQVVVEEEVPVVNMERPKLRQLTTKPVAGFREIKLSASSTPELYYVEMGTGHVYSINLTSGEEIRISGTTIPQAIEAEISSTGAYVAIASVSNTKSKPLVVGELSSSTGSFSEIYSETVQDFSIGQGNELLFTTTGNQGLIAEAYNLKNNTKKNLFSIPFYEASIQWGKNSSSPHYIYPKTSYALQGFLYEVLNGKLNRLPLEGFGFSALANSNYILYNSLVKQTLTSNIYNRSTGVSSKLEGVVLPEKCYIAEGSFVFLCAYESTETLYELPDTWYRGEVSYKDTIYTINTDVTDNEVRLVSQLLVDTLKESGREIDGINFNLNGAGTIIYFTNKNDNTLWMYEI